MIRLGPGERAWLRVGRSEGTSWARPYRAKAFGEVRFEIVGIWKLRVSLLHALESRKELTGSSSETARRRVRVRKLGGGVGWAFGEGVIMSFQLAGKWSLGESAGRAVVYNGCALDAMPLR